MATAVKVMLGVSMLMNIYVIKDRVAEACSPSYEAVNDGIALREFRNVVIKAGQNPGVDVADFELYHVAKINRETCVCVGLDNPRKVTIESYEEDVRKKQEDFNRAKKERLEYEGK